MRKHQWRDSEGFGRPIEVEEAVYSVIGPDDLNHAVRCEFITEKGILPCSCDATRIRSTRPGTVGTGWWWKCWFRWQEIRVRNSPRPFDRLPWPVAGPDGDPWVSGIDFIDASEDDD